MLRISKSSIAASRSLIALDCFRTVTRLSGCAVIAYTSDRVAVNSDRKFSQLYASLCCRCMLTAWRIDIAAASARTLTRSLSSDGKRGDGRYRRER